MFTFNPLEQFEILSILNIVLIRFLTNFCVSNLIIFATLALCLAILIDETGNFYNNYFTFLLNLYAIVKSTISENLSLQRQIYFPALFFLFVFIFASNITGLVPYGFTITNTFVITFFLALSYFIAINILMVYNKGWSMMSAFLPNGVPVALVMMLIIIELISYFARVFSLGIRLFANMLSGHALLKILSGFSWTLMCAKNISIKIVSTIPWLIVTVVLSLEILIAFLQAYVFTILITMYINESFSSH